MTPHRDCLGPLAGIRVIEIAGIGALPHTAMMLADAGAHVLRIDRPGRTGRDLDLISRGRDRNPVERGRPSVVVDLKQPDGAGLVLELLDRADVLVEGFRPGVMERLGLGPDRCQSVNPALVYGRLTGWGQSGPRALQAGHDINYLALSGTLATIGPPDAPPPVPLNLVADFGGGAVVMAFGVLAAIIEARQTGVGRVVDAAMVDGAAALATYIHGMRGAGTWVDQRGANVLDGGAPFYGVYATADCRYIAVGAIEPQFYSALLEGLGLDSATLPAQLDRSRWAELRQHFAECFVKRTLAEWCAVFDGVDACVTPVLTMDEAPADPHLGERDTFIEVDGVTQPAPVPRFSPGPVPLPHGPVRPGEGGRRALVEWGVQPDRIDQLIAQDVVELTDTCGAAS